ncbi:hypothetical protein [Aurantiacibacter marinus]|nr:hypothetical protein [Aurantiacibacter marinus]
MASAPVLPESFLKAARAESGTFAIVLENYPRNKEIIAQFPQK